MLANKPAIFSLKRPFSRFQIQSRINRRLVERIMDKLADEPVARHEACPVHYKSDAPFPKTPFWPWAGSNHSYHSSSAHIVMHPNAIVVFGYRLMEGAEAFSPPFYISLNENPALDARLPNVKKVSFLSLQTIGKVMELEFIDPDLSTPITLTIKELDLFGRQAI